MLHLHLMTYILNNEGLFISHRESRNGNIIFHFLQKIFFHVHCSRTSSTYPYTSIHKKHQQKTKSALSKQQFIITNPLQLSSYLPKSQTIIIQYMTWAGEEWWIMEKSKTLCLLQEMEEITQRGAFLWMCLYTLLPIVWSCY